MFFLTKFWSSLRGWFSVKTPTIKVDPGSLEGNDSPPVQTILQPATPKKARFSLSRQELEGVRRLQKRHNSPSEATVIKVAISRFGSRLGEFEDLRGTIKVPPPIPKEEGMHFTIGDKAESKLRVLCGRVGISDENMVMRIAVRDLLTSKGIKF
ncbi:MAG: hypothetical protein UW63_C0074G0002 [Candidatus Uhrbacteria bacterium GW2011_GWF2_44_350]|uniref:Uncharacterized protein n=1 Tax=Candidatus Uhrbacteria bacterium GW2011_GWF2_44_350 TaxID=1619000 RepID=A0A0G1LIA3_9BACT|nr:MAG: hypothetical protein UW63_C0074G0002 [Candidatus Uhrbacteria bacterium GW2011_GWF2_44_350]HBR81112.1 hypothetical protein [Candidatus Uhrbacteria bacterium]HCU31115.1 hypothetical protein [Candidatus Uhrbacteria bacterium]